MFNFPSHKEIEELQDFHEPGCVTIYAPSLEANGPSNPTRIELKNLLKDVLDPLF